MKSKVLLCSIVVSLFTVPGIAEWIFWTNGSGDRCWSNPQNWDLGRVPAADDQVCMDHNCGGGPVIEGDIVVDWFVIGSGWEPGASLDCEVTIAEQANVLCNEFFIADNTTANVVYNQYGNMTVNNISRLGLSGIATVNIYGGTFNSVGPLGIGYNPGSITRVNIYNGSLETTNTLVFSVYEATDILVDIQGDGQLICGGSNFLIYFQHWISQGWIKSYGLSERVGIDYGYLNPGKNTAYALQYSARNRSDLNLDEIVDMDDFFLFASQWLLSETWWQTR
ncbi:hypothetical protein SMSP2_00764 [Limihaloglobus sulfuriphilus]|uniref:Uncharacterized protein n=1 Tax=Limihaloglobus sulfuriphilus TaxID=1851148 RepID=A0A1Q2MCI5_9BACT|nr:hypothetical protein [Limihaloglobus sulfuriphilus]AQQ70416.1 hypothetical protein SMSP2_00764 [Limihaloglobus sulfuriphilus]